MTSTVTPTMSTLPQLSGKHRKSKVNIENPEKEFLLSTVDTLKVSIAKSDLEIKKLKESNDIKAKRIMNLEAQLEEAKNTITKHKCLVSEERQEHPYPSHTQELRQMSDGFQEIKVANIETRTNAIEHNISLLSAKLENLQFNFLAEKKSNSADLVSRTQETPKTYLCDICEYESAEKASLKTHKESCLSSYEAHVSNSSTDFACQTCSYIAIHKNDLKRHETQMHGQNLPTDIYGCEKCEYSTQHENKLKKHIQDRHTQQSRYFYRQKGTKSEMNQHSLKPNDCTSVGDLEKHKSTHTRQSVQKPIFSGPSVNNQAQKIPIYKCNECGSNLVHEDEHKLHMEYFHSLSKQNKEQ